MMPQETKDKLMVLRNEFYDLKYKIDNIDSTIKQLEKEKEQLNKKICTNFQERNQILFSKDL